MAISNFLKRKLAKAFYMFDRDKDGLVTESDFKQLGEAVAAAQGVGGGSERHQKILDVHEILWSAYFKGADADGDGQVTLEEYFALMAVWRSSDPDATAHAVAANEQVFDAIDANGNGVLSGAELVTYLSAFGVSEAMARTAFAALDLDGDGSLTRAEFARNVTDYYVSESRGPSEWFYGGH